MANSNPFSAYSKEIFPFEALNCPARMKKRSHLSASFPDLAKTLVNESTILASCAKDRTWHEIIITTSDNAKASFDSLKVIRYTGYFVKTI
jgi:hypothetical protein